MVPVEILIIIIFTAAKSTLTDSLEVTTKVKECNPNKVYKKDDVICICSSDGKWPHHNCSGVFTTKYDTICEPHSYVVVDCNICKCSERGNIEEDLCTKHICDKDSQNTIIRRTSTYNNHNCEPNHWYALSSCRFCYCITKNKLLCSGDIYKQRRVFLGKLDMTDCGSSFLSDVIKLFSFENPSEVGIKNEKQSNIAESKSEAKAAEVDTNKKVKIARQDVPLTSFNSGEELAIDANDNKSKSNSVSGSVENNSDPENGPKLTEGKPIGKIAANTLIPFSKEKDYSDNDSQDIENLSLSRGSDNEFGSEKKEDLDSSDKVSSILHASEIQNNESNEIQDSKSFLRVKIPEVFKNVFNFGRRSLVSLENADCVPGSTVIVRCNTCFCLKNGKMLCTKKKCT